MTTQISELGRAQRRRRAVAPVSDGAAVTTVEPVPRIALTQQEACASLGCSEEFFVEHLHVFSFVSIAMLADRVGFQPIKVERLQEPSTKFTLRAFLARAANP